MFDSMREALDRAAAEGLSLGELALRAEAEAGLRTRPEVEAALHRALEVMRGAVGRGREGDLRSVSGLVGGDAALVANSPGPLGGTLFTDVLSGALAVQEVNAA
ncbi:MAG TPA: serine dehydratase, partial [Gemmatimonadales bacterium]|nr:serine dehydratase [Gemmatimonadales bacterium]